jgi:oxaloacetate decarboxylase alpha subunit/pyruvate carboxylase subunit B
MTEPRMGGDVYTLDYYVTKAKELEEMGADSICVKDMAGLMAPYDAFLLFKALKATVKAPLHLHSHFTSGMAPMTHLKAIEAGVDIVDTCMSPYAYRTSHPAVEPMVMALLGTNRDTGFDINQLAQINEIFEKDIIPKYRHLLDDTKMSIIDINVLLHQTPGGMLSNLVNQLREMDALDKLGQVFTELPRVREDLGQIPLVTPTSQIVGIQTVNNVLFDDENERYKMITAQVKDLCYGLYGKTAVPINPEVQKKALKDYPRGEEPITCRPAEVLEPELAKAQEETKELARDLDDELIYAIYPVTGKKFLQWKYGLEEVPAEMKPRTLDDAQREKEWIDKAKAGKLVEKIEKIVPEMGDNLRKFNVLVDGEYFEVEVEDVDGSPYISSVSQAAYIPAAAPPPPPPPPAAPRAAAPAAPKPAPPPSPAADDGDGTPLVAPMPGMIVGLEKQEGDQVSEGETVMILEAMKMENGLPAPASGTISKISFGVGDHVKKNDVLCIIS